MRLIDADMLLNSFKGAKKLGVDAIKFYIDNTPTIDLVRCGECKYWDGIECQNDGASTDLEGGAEYTLYRDDTDFCSYGERRSE